MNLLLEGTDLEALLLRAHQEGGSAAKIVRAEKVRRGGFLGFFAREGFEVAVEIPAQDGTPEGDDHRSADAHAAAEPTDGSGAQDSGTDDFTPDPLLGLADRVSAAERAASQALAAEVARESATDDARASAREAAAQAQAIAEAAAAARFVADLVTDPALVDQAPATSGTSGTANIRTPQPRSWTPVDLGPGNDDEHSAEYGREDGGAALESGDDGLGAGRPPSTWRYAGHAVLDGADPLATPPEAATDAPEFTALVDELGAGRHGRHRADGPHHRSSPPEPDGGPVETGAWAAVLEAAGITPPSEDLAGYAETADADETGPEGTSAERTDARQADAHQTGVRESEGHASRSPGAPLPGGHRGSVVVAARATTVLPAPPAAAPTMIPRPRPADEGEPIAAAQRDTDDDLPAPAAEPPWRRRDRLRPRPVAPTGGETPGAEDVAADRAALESLGVPADWSERLAPGDRFSAVHDMLERLPEPDIDQHAPVVAVIGPATMAELEAHRTALDLPVGARPRAVVTVPARGAEERRAAVAAARTIRPVVVAVESDGYGDPATARKALRSVQPDVVIAVLDATRPVSASARWLEEFDRIDAVALDGAMEVADPAAVMALDLPVTRMDGMPMDRLAWTTLLCAHLAARAEAARAEAG